MQANVAQQLQETVTGLSNIAKSTELHRILVAVVTETAKSKKSGHKMMVDGNGENIDDVQYLVAKFVSGLTRDHAALRADRGHVYFDYGWK